MDRTDEVRLNSGFVKAEEIILAGKPCIVLDRRLTRQIRNHAVWLPDENMWWWAADVGELLDRLLDHGYCEVTLVWGRGRFLVTTWDRASLPNRSDDL